MSRDRRPPACPALPVFGFCIHQRLLLRGASTAAWPLAERQRYGSGDHQSAAQVAPWPQELTTASRQQGGKDTCRKWHQAVQDLSLCCRHNSLALHMLASAQTAMLDVTLEKPAVSAREMMAGKHASHTLVCSQAARVPGPRAAQTRTTQTVVLLGSGHSALSDCCCAILSAQSPARKASAKPAT